MDEETKRILIEHKKWLDSIEKVAHGDVVKPGDMLYIHGKLAQIYKASDEEIGEKVDHNTDHPIYRKKVY